MSHQHHDELDEELCKQEARRTILRSGYLAQQDPKARRQANRVVVFLLVPMLLLCIGAVVVFVIQNPDGMRR